MFGLFKRTYDWYEWNDFIVASASKDKLIKKYNDEFKNDYPLIDEAKYYEYKDGENGHYCIVKLEEI